MPMPARRREALRFNAQRLGTIFQLLAVATLLVTIWTFLKVLSLGSQIGINGVHNPAAWMVLAGGLFATLTLTGFGTALGMLCALYDQQSDAAQPSATPLGAVE